MNKIKKRLWTTIWTAATATVAWGQSNAGIHVREGDEYLKNHRYPEAAAAYERALGVQPTLTDALYGAATAYRRLCRYETALKYASKLTNLAPEDARGYAEIGAVKTRLKKFQEAEEALHQAVKLDPSAENLTLRAELYYAWERRDRAEVDVKKALEIKEDYAPAVALNAIIMAENEMMEDALRELSRYIANHPQSYEAYAARAWVNYLAQQDMNPAILDAEQAIKINPFFIPAYRHKAFALSLSGENLDAEKTYTEALAFDPQNPDLYFERGCERMALDMRGEALDDFDKALKLRPDFAMVYVQRGILRTQMEDYPAAVRDLSRALELEPSNAWAYLCRGHAYIGARDVKNACDDYKNAEKYGHPNGTMFFEQYCGKK
ncbi:MAG: tetratricopeptide repeat protein [Bacteroidia bacterium]|nr:tetratricopeptide repeat protein [Bacteroidia bacterium]MDW8332775.1 tetratricopeptide repeat protein [Bacteroidia bacterium]